MSADLHAGNVEAEGGRDQAGGISTGPFTVGVVTEVELEPSGGDLAKCSGGNLSRITSATTLAVGIESNALLATTGQLEGESLVADEKAVDANTIGSNLVPAHTLLLLVGPVGESGEILVLVSNVGLDKHHVAAVVALDANISLVSDLGKSGALGVALAERNIVVISRAGILALGSLNLNLGLSGRRGGCRSRSRCRDRRRSRLLSNHELATSLHGAVGVSVSMAAGVGRHTEGGGQENSGCGELHFDCRILTLIVKIRVKGDTFRFGEVGSFSCSCLFRGGKGGWLRCIHRILPISRLDRSELKECVVATNARVPFLGVLKECDSTQRALVKE